MMSFLVELEFITRDLRSIWSVSAYGSHHFESSWVAKVDDGEQ